MSMAVNVSHSRFACLGTTDVIIRRRSASEQHANNDRRRNQCKVSYTAKLVHTHTITQKKDDKIKRRQTGNTIKYHTATPKQHKNRKT
jgi:hypothetical protein